MIHYNIVIFPSSVQGENAPRELIRAINKANEYTNIDVLIVGRGGGSIEDLWAFNNEQPAYAIYDSRIPIISAVGHETDFSISDFVADMRDRRAGDPAILISDNSKIRSIMQWEPKYDDLELICKTALEWERKI